MIEAARKYHDLFYLTSGCIMNKSIPNSSLYCSVLVNNTTCNLWHMKLSHPSNKILQILASQNSSITSSVVNACDACAFTKQKCLPYITSITKSTHFFELIHVHIWGLLLVISLDGFKYFLTIVDDFSHFTWILFLKNKTDVRTSLQHFILFIENKFHAS